MVCLGIEPGAAGWKVQINPLSYGGTLLSLYFKFVTDHEEVEILILVLSYRSQCHK